MPSPLPSHYPRVWCGPEQKLVPGYMVCVHILDRATIVHHVEPSAHEPGEALCAACMSRPELDVDALRLVCLPCFTKALMT